MAKKIIIFLFAISLCSCVSKKKILYFQNIAAADSSKVNYQAHLQPDDLLMIMVSSEDPELSSFFNLPAVGTVGTNPANPDAASSQSRFQTYLIDNEGFIEFPVLGKLKMSGLTRIEASEMIKGRLVKYVKDPIINLRIVNYKVSVMGEVARPGEIDVLTERITLPEALSNVGDMTIYGNRKHVLVIREVEGKKTYNYIDMTKADFFNSPFYYLTQNDMVVVEQNKTKVNSSMVGPNVTVGLTALSLIITIIALATK